MKKILILLALTGFAIPLSHASSTSAPKNLQSKVGKRLTVTGLAENAKLGAVIMVNHEPIYLKDMSAWTDIDNHQIMRVTGVLRQFQQPVATQEPGAVSAGVAGPGIVYQFVNYQSERVTLGN